MRIFGGKSTYVGTVREINQDCVVYESTSQNGDTFTLLAVCDGIGGLEKGEVASAIVAEEIKKWYRSICAWIDISEADSSIIFSHLKDAAEEWNRMVYDYQLQNNIRMGTTMSLLMILRNTYYIIQVGDSRVYLYKNRELSQLTIDASVSRLKNGRMKQYLDNFVGKAEELWFTSLVGTIEDGNLFLVCSDGLYHHLKDNDLEKSFSLCLDGKSDDECSRLIDEMMSRGETDNISAVIAAVSLNNSKKKSFWKK